MGKRVDPDHDATQDISMSQLVPDMPRERPVIQRGNPQNDASMWIGGVVSSDDFAPTAKKRAPGKSRTLIWAVVAAFVASVAAATIWYVGLRDEAPATAAATTPAPAPIAAPAPTAAPAPSAAAATPAVPAPAPTVAAAAPVDAAVVQPTVAADPAMVVDAISSVGAPIKAKAVKKKKVAKKKPATKKAAPTTKRR